MASSITLQPPFKKEDVLSRPSGISRRPPVIAVPRRSRLIKAKPNIGPIKSLKDLNSVQLESNETDQPEHNENTSIEKQEEPLLFKKPPTDSFPTEPGRKLENVKVTVKKGLDASIELPPTLKKQAVIPAGVRRARFQKARPNLAGLNFKASKNAPVLVQRNPATSTNVQHSKEVYEEENPLKEGTVKSSLQPSVSQNNLGFPFPHEVGALSESQRTSHSIDRLSENSELDVNIKTTQCTDLFLTRAIVEISEDQETHYDIHKLSQNIQVQINVTETQTINMQYNTTETEKVLSSELTQNGHIEDKDESSASNGNGGAAKIMSRDFYRQDPSVTNSSTALLDQTNAENDFPVVPPPAINKSLEYPTLKSILNSPRKRTVTKRVHEKKRRLANLSANPSRSEMTMTDLIYWNPTTSPMKSSQPRTTAVENLPPDDNCEPLSLVAEEHQKEMEEDEGQNSSAPVPKVIINEDGEIILDESSLVVRRKETIDKTVEAIVENDNTTYSSFRKRSAKQWTTKETSKFYKALSLVGTDFALMESIFTVDGKVTRSRRELKLKFKREEKQNTEFVHRAMYESQTYDVSILDEDPDDPAINIYEVDSPPKRGKKRNISGSQTKVPCKRKKKPTTAEEVFNDLNSITDENDQDEEIEISFTTTEQITSDGNESNDNADEIVLESLVGVPRIQRERKIKVMSDYVTNVDDLSDPDDIYIVSERSGASIEHIRPPKKKIIEEYVEPAEEVYADTFPEIELETSRSGRIIRSKVLPDFITLDDSDDGSDQISNVDEIIKPVQKQRMQILSEDSADESMNNTEKSIEPTTESSVNPISHDPDKDGNPDIICLSSQNTDNFIKLPPFSTISQGNLLTDAEISEVVTSMKPLQQTKRLKKKPTPNLGGQRIPTQPKPHFSHQPSFTNFTPVEEHFVTQKSPRNYSRMSVTPISQTPVHLHSSVVSEQISSPISGNSFYTAVTPKQVTEDGPIVIMTKSPNNENILHLFMVNSPS